MPARRAVLWALLLSAAAPLVHGADHAGARRAALAALPDWSGLWEMGRPGGPGGPPDPARDAAPAAAPPANAPRAGGPPRIAIPYQPQWRQRFDAYERQLESVTGTEQIPDTTVTRCIWGIPRIFVGPYQFEVTVTPGLVVFTYDVGEYRRVWTDGRGHPSSATLRPTNMGHSIGHWEGATLVIDTIGLRPDIWVSSSGATLSEQTHVVERWSKSADGRLSVAATVADPARLDASYQVGNSYRRVTDTQRMVQQSCHENVREVLEGDRVITRFGAGT